MEGRLTEMQNKKAPNQRL